jgi:rare lipoprotein A
MMRSHLLAALAAIAIGVTGPVTAQTQKRAGSGERAASTPAQQQADGRKPRATAAKGHKLDRSGRKRVGKASVYARKFAGRKMADGTPMRPHDDNAASKTLPLGTTAKVTNLETGKAAEVTIQDRGPYVPGRIVDLAPGTAQEIGITPKQGVAPVEVAPITVPQPDGGVRKGDGAR